MSEDVASFHWLINSSDVKRSIRQVFRFTLRAKKHFFPFQASCTFTNQAIFILVSFARASTSYWSEFPTALTLKTTRTGIGSVDKRCNIFSVITDFTANSSVSTHIAEPKSFWFFVHSFPRILYVPVLFHDVPNKNYPQKNKSNRYSYSGQQ